CSSTSITSGAKRRLSRLSSSLSGLASSAASERAASAKGAGTAGSSPWSSSRATISWRRWLATLESILRQETEDGSYKLTTRGGRLSSASLPSSVFRHSSLPACSD